MLDAIVTTLAHQFKLGDQARPFLQMLLARIDDPARGGLPGLIQRLRAGGMGDDVDDWMASSGPVAPVDAPVLEAAMGDDTLAPAMAARFGLDHPTVLAALAYAVPALIRRVCAGGTVPPTMPAEAHAMLGAHPAGWVRTEAAAAAAPVEPAPARSRNWMPWIGAAVAAVLLLGYCSTRDRDDTAVPAQEATAPVAGVPAGPAAEVVVAEPEGAGVVASPAGVVPSLKVYFDSGKADVSGEFAASAANLIEYMNGNTITVAVISGFNDPTGDPAANALLAKQRAEAVQQALVAAGVPKERTVLEKPAETTGTGATNTASRRVDVVIRE